MCFDWLIDWKADYFTKRNDWNALLASWAGGRAGTSPRRPSGWVSDWPHGLVWRRGRAYTEWCEPSTDASQSGQTELLTSDSHCLLCDVVKCRVVAEADWFTSLTLVAEQTRILIIHAEHVVHSAWILFWLWMYVCMFVCYRSRKKTLDRMTWNSEP